MILRNKNQSQKGRTVLSSKHELIEQYQKDIVPVTQTCFLCEKSYPCLPGVDETERIQGATDWAIGTCRMHFTCLRHGCLDLAFLLTIFSVFNRYLIDTFRHIRTNMNEDLHTYIQRCGPILAAGWHGGSPIGNDIGPPYSLNHWSSQTNIPVLLCWFLLSCRSSPVSSCKTQKG